MCVCSEELGDDNPWYCSSCQSQQRALRTLTVHRVPPVLIIHLKRSLVYVLSIYECLSDLILIKHDIVRFIGCGLCLVTCVSLLSCRFMYHGGGSKLEVPVDFPQTLKVQDVCSLSSSNDDCLHLVAMVCHFGSELVIR